MRIFHWFGFLGLSFAMLGLSALAIPATAAHTFRIQVDPNTEIEREVECFLVEKVGQGYVVLSLNPYQPDLEKTLLQLGEKRQFGEKPVPGEATWLAYVAETRRVVARLSSTLSESQVPTGTVVLSARPNDKAGDPVDAAIEAAKALAQLDYSGDAQMLLQSLAGNTAHQASRCKILKALLDLQMPATPTAGEALPESADKTLRELLRQCEGLEGEAASRILARWTLARLEAQPTLPAEQQATVINDALRLCANRPGGDELLLALARIHYRQGNAEEGTKAIETFLEKFATSPIKDQARELQERLARRAPARGYRFLGNLGPRSLRATLGFRRITALAFDPQGRLILLDGNSSPAKVVVAEIKTQPVQFKPSEPIYLYKDWEPISVTRDSEENFYFVDYDEDQIVATDSQGYTLSSRIFPTRGAGWKLRSPKLVHGVQDRELLVLDVSSRQLYRFEITGNYIGGMDLSAVGFKSAHAAATAPDGMALLATRDQWSVFDPAKTPMNVQPARRGLIQLKIRDVGMCRWQYVYLFDDNARRLEKFRRNGEWLTTVIDCNREGIRDPGPWAVSPEGDIVIYDVKNDVLNIFSQ
jgi:hypothetical protein